jgi:rubrerythrin
MDIEKALETAIDIENKIRSIYADALTECGDEAGRRILSMLRDDEQYHMTYLEKQLEQWRKTGELIPTRIDSIIPMPDEIQEHLEKLKKTMAKDDRGMIRQLLGKALQVEVQTSEFYNKMVLETYGSAKTIFNRFLEIENAHIQAVQNELDYVMNTGYWFDFKEFDME